jgi:FAD:protein FMN transferase
MDTSSSTRRARPLLGTFVEIAAVGAATCALQHAIDEAFGVVAQVHRLMSFHDPESDVSRLNRGAFSGAIPVNAWTYEVLKTALDLHRRSNGLFDVTAASSLQRLGLLPRCANEIDLVVEETTTADQIDLLPDSCVRYRQAGVRIDLGGIAKGFAVDLALDVLCKRGVKQGLVNAGGDLAAFGIEPELVHIRNPGDVCRPLCQIEIRNAALASSGRLIDPLRFSDAGECAIVDPDSRRQVRAVAGATVRAPTCMIADALTKVAMIAGQGASGLLQRYGASALLILESGDVWVTPDWQDTVRLAA